MRNMERSSDPIQTLFFLHCFPINEPLAELGKFRSQGIEVLFAIPEFKDIGSSTQSV